MSYNIELSKKTTKFLDKQSDKFFADFFDKAKIIAKNPHINNLDIKPLKGKKGHYRLRIGKYRFLYEIIENKIIIYFYDANNRGQIYK